MSSLCEKLSQTCGELRSCYCGVCFYAIVLPTGKITALSTSSHDGERVMQIWWNIDKYGPIYLKKPKTAVRMISQKISYFHQNKTFKETIAAS